MSSIDVLLQSSNNFKSRFNHVLVVKIKKHLPSEIFYTQKIIIEIFLEISFSGKAN